MLIHFFSGGSSFTFIVQLSPLMKHFKLDRIVIYALLIFLIAAAIYFQYVVTLI